MSYVLNILFTSNLKFLSSICFSTGPQLNVGCFSASLPSLVTMLVGLLLTPELVSPAAVAMACTAVFAISTAACAMACFIAAWSVTILYYFLTWL